MVLNFWGFWSLPCPRGCPPFKVLIERGDRVTFVGIDEEDAGRRPAPSLPMLE